MYYWLMLLQFWGETKTGRGPGLCEWYSGGQASIIIIKHHCYCYCYVSDILEFKLLLLLLLLLLCQWYFGSRHPSSSSNIIVIVIVMHLPSLTNIIVIVISVLTIINDMTCNMITVFAIVNQVNPVFFKAPVGDVWAAQHNTGHSDGEGLS